MKFLLIILFAPVFCIAQNKKDNLILVKGVSFQESVSSILDAGFIIEKIDSNFKTLSTDFKEGKDKNKWMKLRFHIRVKDSTVYIKGDWYNTIFIGKRVLGTDQSIENNTERIIYSSGNAKACFEEMKKFALSFNKPVEYKKE